MGIHGIFKQIGAGRRISLAKLSSEHFTAYNRPLRLAIDVSIWLFQIQSGKGGSNPALRTFYYRLLRLLNLNIHPLFVFDGPNKPLFKRNKKVGGPGVRVASVPEFLAKQLLKQFGFPWHVAPGEAEAECAHLQRRSIVDMVLSEDVDTLMFGSGVTVRNWTPEGSTKTPTHVNLYRAEETKANSGLDSNGMILVALMSGGDYLPDGIPGCGPKLACDAARAGFGQDLCLLDRKDKVGLRLWKDRLTHQIHTNEGNHFGRKTPSFKMPDEFPNMEVLGYYTHPCVSSEDKLARLQDTLRWDHDIDFAALRTFTAEAFDWRCLGGAQKFIRNLAPAMLTRELRLRGVNEQHQDEEAQEQAEERLVSAIHGKRLHYSTDGVPEYRISFTPTAMVPIDLSQEEIDDEFLNPEGEEAEDVERELFEAPEVDGRDTQDPVPGSPAKKQRQFKPYDATQPEKLWIMHSFLQIGCPLLIETYEGRLRTGKSSKVVEGKKARKGGKPKSSTAQSNNILTYATVVKSTDTLKEKVGSLEDEIETVRSASRKSIEESTAAVRAAAHPQSNRAAFRLPNMTLPADPLSQLPNGLVEQERVSRPFAAFATKPSVVPRQMRSMSTRPTEIQKTPRKKRPSPDLSSPATGQRVITSFYSPSPQKTRMSTEVISLLSSSPPRASSPTPLHVRHGFVRSPVLQDLDTNERAPSVCHDYSPGKLPDSVTKRRKKGPLRRHRTAPVFGHDDTSDMPEAISVPEQSVEVYPVNESRQHARVSMVDALDLTSSSPIKPQRTTFVLTESATNHVPDESSHTCRANDRADIAPWPNAVCRPNSEIPKIMPAVNMQLESIKSQASHEITGRKSMTAHALRRSPRHTPVGKKHIQLRDSLSGAWKEVAVDQVDLTDDKKASKGWRLSMVETVDMTGT